MEHRELKCCVCDYDYSDEMLPRILQCGHSLCSTCASQLILSTRKCPECRHPILVSDSKDLPVNYPLLRISRILLSKEPQLNSTNKLKFPLSLPKSEPQQNAGKCPSHGISMFFMCVRCSVPVCRDCIKMDHLDAPYGHCLVLSIKEAVDKLKASNTKTTDSYTLDAHNIWFELEEEQREVMMIRKFYESLRHGFNNNTTLDALKETEMVYQANLSKVSSLKSVIDSLNQGRKIKEASTVEELIEFMEESTASHESFEQYRKEEEGRRTLNIEETFLDFKQDLKELVLAGRPVYGIAEDMKLVKCAPLTAHNQHFHLHALRDYSYSEGDICLPFDLVRRMAPQESPVVFLEVGWQGEVKGHVYIGLFGDTPRSRQTLYLCSGEKGVSYRNTCFYEVGRYKNGCHILSGGDYENNDGTGGRGIVEGITSGGSYHHEVTAGLFVSWPSHEQWHLGNFDIYLKDSPGIYDHSAHGMVVQGLDVLREAADVVPISDASVVDCGLIISL